jgi:hypothetical protein
VVLDSELKINIKINKHDLDKLERNKDIKDKHDEQIYVIERFVINVIWKGIVSCLWIHMGARLDVLRKGNIVFLWILENDFVSTIMNNSDLVNHETHCVGKIIYLSFLAYKERPYQSS